MPSRKNVSASIFGQHKGGNIAYCFDGKNKRYVNQLNSGTVFRMSQCVKSFPPAILALEPNEIGHAEHSRQIVIDQVNVRDMYNDSRSYFMSFWNTFRMVLGGLRTQNTSMTEEEFNEQMENHGQLDFGFVKQGRRFCRVKWAPTGLAPLLGGPLSSALCSQPGKLFIECLRMNDDYTEIDSDSHIMVTLSLSGKTQRCPFPHSAAYYGGGSSSTLLSSSSSNSMSSGHGCSSSVSDPSDSSSVAHSKRVKPIGLSIDFVTNEDGIAEQPCPLKSLESFVRGIPFDLGISVDWPDEKETLVNPTPIESCSSVSSSKKKNKTKRRMTVIDPPIEVFHFNYGIASSEGRFGQIACVWHGGFPMFFRIEKDRKGAYQLRFLSRLNAMYGVIRVVAEMQVILVGTDELPSTDVFVFDETEEHCPIEGLVDEKPGSKRDDITLNLRHFQLSILYMKLCDMSVLCDSKSAVSDRISLTETAQPFDACDFCPYQIADFVVTIEDDRRMPSMDAGQLRDTRFSHKWDCPLVLDEDQFDFEVEYVLSYVPRQGTTEENGSYQRTSKSRRSLEDSFDRRATLTMIGPPYGDKRCKSANKERLLHFVFFASVLADQERHELTRKVVEFKGSGPWKCLLCELTEKQIQKLEKIGRRRKEKRGNSLRISSSSSHLSDAVTACVDFTVRLTPILKRFLFNERRLSKMKRGTSEMMATDEPSETPKKPSNKARVHPSWVMAHHPFSETDRDWNHTQQWLNQVISENGLSVMRPSLDVFREQGLYTRQLIATLTTRNIDALFSRLGERNAARLIVEQAKLE